MMYQGKFNKTLHKIIYLLTLPFLCTLRHVLSIILSDKNREDVVREIHDYMKNTGARIINNEFQLDDFIIRKVKFKENIIINVVKLNLIAIPFITNSNLQKHLKNIKNQNHNLM